MGKEQDLLVAVKTGDLLLAHKLLSKVKCNKTSEYGAEGADACFYWLLQMGVLEEQLKLINNLFGGIDRRLISMVSFSSISCMELLYFFPYNVRFSPQNTPSTLYSFVDCSILNEAFH